MSLSSPMLKQVVIISGITVGAICLVTVAFSIFSYQFGRKYDGAIYPGLSINRIDVGGLSADQARERVNQTIRTALVQGMRFQVGDQMVNISQDDLLAHEPALIRYDVEKAIEQAERAGRTGSFFRKAFVRLQLAQGKRTIPLDSVLEEELLQAIVTSSSARFLPTAQNAALLLVSSPDQPTEIRIQPERNGQTIHWEAAANLLQTQVQTISFSPINVPLLILEPRWKEADITPLKPQAENWLSHAPFRLSAEGKTLTIDQSTLASWIGTTTTNQAPALELNPDQMRLTLENGLGSIIQPAKEGFIDIEDNKLKTFIAPEVGTEIDLAATRQTILDRWTNATTSLPITLMRVTPQIKGEDAEQLGIREVIGEGKSNFSGSPSNRRYNIKLGAERVHGSLIAPDTEFSMIKTLGEIDGAHGWLPELVIKGNKTTPEFGGGLCQIGTTAFRGALNTGLLITERRNHSYRVRYYEPAGTDATIYDPSPDFRFKNDTPHWILITSKLIGDNVTFTFWGTNDGRTVDLAKPVVSNITAPPPKKMIETTDLAPGQVKCTETAHAGATAKLDYAVTYPNGETKKVTFTSVYRPWGAVCLVGATNPTPTGEGVDETGVNNPN